MSCAFSHEHIRLSAETAGFLEAAFSRMFGGSTAPLPDDTATFGADTDSGSLAAVLEQVVALFRPWAPTLREAASGSATTVEKISHEALEFVSDLLVESELDELIEGQIRRLTEIHPRQSAGFAGLPIAERTGLLADYLQVEAEVRERCARAIGRVMMRSLPGFLAKLAKLAKDYRRGEESMRAAFGRSPGAWDLESGTWTEEALAGLDDAADTVGRNPDFAKLMDSLGRRALAGSSAARDQAPARTFAEEGELALGKQELTGVSSGNDPEAVMPLAYAQLAHPGARSVFFADFAEKKLASYAYKTRLGPSNKNHQEKKEAASPEQDLGPFVLCVDTSGSMAGLPERCAKALALAAFRRALATGRKLGLVMFSDRALSEIFVPPGNPAFFASFLAHSFKGGTDLRPALDETIRLVNSLGLQDADVLVISDFRIPKIMVKKSARLRQIQETHGTRIHAVTVGGHAIQDDYNLFESRWLCRATSPSAAAGIDATIHETD